MVYLQWLNSFVLVAYLRDFDPEQIDLLKSWGLRARYWPRTWREHYLESEPADWWLEFDSDELLVEWMLRYTEDSRIMRTLFD
jgi:hypothetical protein